MASLRTRQRKSGTWFYVVTRRRTIAAGQQHSVALEILAEAKRIESGLPPTLDPAPDGEPTGTVYFIETETGEIKIGFTDRDPIGRLRALQTGCPLKLTLLATIPANVNYERSLHLHFGASRLQGEWFSPTRDLLSLIERIRALPPPPVKVIMPIGEFRLGMEKP